VKTIRVLTAICLSAAALALLLAWAGSSPAQAATRQAPATPAFTVAATITVGGKPHGVTVDTINNTVYVANYASNTVSVVNGNTLAVVDTISADFPSGLVYNPADGRLYVGSNPDSDSDNGSIWIINPTTKVRENVHGAYHPGGLAVYNGGVYFANHKQCPDFNCVGHVYYDHLDNQGVTGQDYAHLVIDTWGNKYVTAHNGGSDRQVNLVGNDNEEWTTHVDTARGLWGIAWDPVGDKLYAAAMDAGKVAKVRRDPLTYIGAIDPPETASLAMVAVDPDERLLFVTQNQTTNCNPLTDGAPEKLYIYDLQAGDWFTTTLTLGQDPDQGIAIDTSRKRLYVTNRCSNTLSVISYGDAYKVYLPLIQAGSQG
jgi:YVTN family beta-propeller protein